MLKGSKITQACLHVMVSKRTLGFAELHFETVYILIKIANLRMVSRTKTNIPLHILRPLNANLVVY